MNAKRGGSYSPKSDRALCIVYYAKMLSQFPGWLLWVLWIIWSITLVALMRIGLVKTLPLIGLTENRYGLAYASLLAFLLLGFVVAGLSGVPLYGFDQNNWRHWLGYVTLLYSPLGLPIILGTPFVFVSDLIRRPWAAKAQAIERHV